jgi:hypothetical protein
MLHNYRCENLNTSEFVLAVALRLLQHVVFTILVPLLGSGYCRQRGGVFHVVATV